jgi:hypothetical protein
LIILACKLTVTLLQIRDRRIVHEIDVLVLDGAPQAFDRYAVQG